MTKRVLAIGIGGSGKTALTILKERLEETYGQVPDNVVLLSLDTDDLRDGDTFAGTRLNPFVDDRGREPEFQPVVSPAGMTMKTVFADITSGKTAAYMDWLEKDKLQRILGPAEQDIRGGAQQRRPVGRVALYLRWNHPIYSSIVNAISRVYGEMAEEQPIDAISAERSKRQIFIIGSVAGGTGSGFLIDVANLVRHAVQSNVAWQSVDVSAVIVLPEAFKAYTTVMDDPTNLRPNSYAALRELDRFIRTHNSALPYMIRYGTDTNAITWSVNQPLDHIYLVDTAGRGASGDMELSGDPKRGVFPLIADFIAAHIDQSLGDALATLRSNAGQHYGGKTYPYSSFNVMTYLFPVDDVIESFSYRFLRELFDRCYLPLTDKTARAQLEQSALKEVERVFANNTVGGKVNPGVIQKAIAATRRVDAEPPDMSWRGLFNEIALSDSAFAQDYQDLEGWLTSLSSSLSPSKEGEYRRENYDEGYARLLNVGDQFLDDCLGPQLDPDDEASRGGGQWDIILNRYPAALRQRFSEALDAYLLEVLNQRDTSSQMLLPHRLPLAQAVIASLKQKLVDFRALLEREQRQLHLETRVRQSGEELRNAITRMYDTRDKTFALLGKSEARKAQDAYIAQLGERMELLLHQRIYRMVRAILDTLGAAERDPDGTPSVLTQAALTLESWQATFEQADRLLAGWSREHEKHREEKRHVRVRRYMSNPNFEDQIYRQPAHSGVVAMRVLGQVRGETGVSWQREEANTPLSYRMVTVWSAEAIGAEAIARELFMGVKGLFQVVRQNVTIANQVASEFSSPASFVNVVNQISEPFLRYNPSTNGKTMFKERFVSFSLNKASEAASRFLTQASATLANQGLNVDATAETTVACTVVEVSRGVRLGAVDQFLACEPDYRAKIYKGQETLHLLPEEQVATNYEGRIEVLGEPDNRQRLLAPELVVAMGDESKLRAFTLACAYGVVREGLFDDPETGDRSTEIFLTMRRNGTEQRLRLSDSRLVRTLDNTFQNVAVDEQRARLYLNALQNFVLMASEKRGLPGPMVAMVVDNLRNQGVALKHIDNPFTLTVRQVYEQIRTVQAGIGPSETEEPDRVHREAINVRRCIEQCLHPFLEGALRKYKSSPAVHVRDLGTVMHLVLQDEINKLRQATDGA